MGALCFFWSIEAHPTVSWHIAALAKHLLEVGGNAKARWIGRLLQILHHNLYKAKKINHGDV
jgi:hypothetical protein